MKKYTLNIIRYTLPNILIDLQSKGLEPTNEYKENVSSIISKFKETLPLGFTLDEYIELYKKLFEEYHNYILNKEDIDIIRDIVKSYDLEKYKRKKITEELLNNSKTNIFLTFKEEESIALYTEYFIPTKDSSINTNIIELINIHKNNVLQLTKHLFIPNNIDRYDINHYYDTGVVYLVDLGMFKIEAFDLLINKE